MARFFEILNKVNMSNPPVPPMEFAMYIDNMYKAARIHVKEVLDNGDT